MFSELKSKPDFRTEQLDRGRVKHKSYHYCKLATTFKDTAPGVKRVVAMSDLHSLTPEIVQWLVSKKRVTSQTVVITTGDMAGAGKLGQDGDPIEAYKLLRDAAMAFYFVQGNHDDYNAAAFDLVNDDGTPCCVHNMVVETPLGRLGGANGIVVADSHGNGDKHKYSQKEYDTVYNHVAMQHPDIMLTHQPIAAVDACATIHLFGHAHANAYAVEPDGRLLLNMDGRVFQFD
eukprot:TRINITY_DN12238_c2_g1_i2.p2 TRINITY_DN12238_c2_g1~~TRINITY_DN12238_c2_g1_i2.p2  ORF type:complete len:232 (+),score=38.84 TRINITY_DN12238_c2_g1_i2:1989-2684(+)